MFETIRIIRRFFFRFWGKMVWGVSMILKSAVDEGIEWIKPLCNRWFEGFTGFF
jgi:hypothetical protein